MPRVLGIGIAICRGTMENDRPTLKDIGESNAASGLDSAPDYDSLQDSLDSHRDNVLDTASEYGYSHPEACKALDFFEAYLMRKQ